MQVIKETMLFWAKFEHYKRIGKIASTFGII